MKTPMQELLEWVRATLPMDLDTPRLIEEKIESMLEKEKEVMQDFATEYERECRINLERSIEKCWDETFNTNILKHFPTEKTAEDIHPDSAYGQWMKRFNTKEND